MTQSEGMKNEMASRQELVNNLEENDYNSPEDWIIADDKLWVSPLTVLFVIENNALGELFVSVWDPNCKEGPFSKPDPERAAGEG